VQYRIVNNDRKDKKRKEKSTKDLRKTEGAEKTSRNPVIRLRPPAGCTAARTWRQRYRMACGVPCRKDSGQFSLKAGGVQDAIPNSVSEPCVIV
jgi:hypothetical protein